MSKTIHSISRIVVAALALGSQVTMAASIAGIEFDDNAYVDALLGYSGSYQDEGNISIDATQLAAALTDTDATTGAQSSDTGAFVKLGFTDNLMVNGPDEDLVLFELGSPANLEITVVANGTALIYETVPTSYCAEGGSITSTFPCPGLSVNAAKIDLTAFGIAGGATVSDFYVGFDVSQPIGDTTPILSLAAALNSTAVPVPAAVWLFGSGLLGLVGIARRRKKAA